MQGTYRMVESADEVMNVLGSFGCHEQSITSATWPLCDYQHHLAYSSTAHILTLYSSYREYRDLP